MFIYIMRTNKKMGKNKPQGYWIMGKCASMLKALWNDVTYSQ